MRTRSPQRCAKHEISDWRALLDIDVPRFGVFPVEAVSDETAPVLPSERHDSSLRAGKSIFWLRPVIRALQRVTKETMLVFIILGAMLLFAVSWRRALFIATVPLYYFLLQSVMHTEFRYTLPMQYFVFVFASVVWVILFRMALKGLRRIIIATGV